MDGHMGNGIASFGLVNMSSLSSHITPTLSLLPKHGRSCSPRAWPEDSGLVHRIFDAAIFNDVHGYGTATFFGPFTQLCFTFLISLSTAPIVLTLSSSVKPRRAHASILISSLRFWWILNASILFSSYRLTILTRFTMTPSTKKLINR